MREVQRALFEVGGAELRIRRAPPVDVVEHEEIGLPCRVDVRLADLGVRPAEQLGVKGRLIRAGDEAAGSRRVVIVERVEIVRVEAVERAGHKRAAVQSLPALHVGAWRAAGVNRQTIGQARGIDGAVGIAKWPQRILLHAGVGAVSVEPDSGDCVDGAVLPIARINAVEDHLGAARRAPLRRQCCAEAVVGEILSADRR